VHTLIAAITFAILWAWVVAHQLALYYIFAVLIEQMPPPDETSGKFYKWFYAVVQVFAANLRRTKDAAQLPTTVPPAKQP
jgi:hypothetical protein